MPEVKRIALTEDELRGWVDRVLAAFEMQPTDNVEVQDIVRVLGCTINHVLDIALEHDMNAADRILISILSVITAQHTSNANAIRAARQAKLDQLN